MVESNPLPPGVDNHTNVRMENIGNEPLFILENCPMEPRLQQYLYGNVQKRTFDYVSASTDEILPKYVPSWNRDGTTKRLITSAERLMDHTASGSILPAVGEISNQHLEIYNLLHSLMHLERGQEKDQVFFTQFLEILRNDPNKPLLIIYGHGFQDPISGKWLIGERDSAKSIDVNALVEKFTKQKRYSAVILCSCNEGGFQPQAIVGVPILFVKEGPAGGAQQGDPQII